MQWPSFRFKGDAPASSGGPSGSAIAVSWNRDGIAYRPEPARDGWLSEAGSFGADAELAMLLGQLEEEGFAELGADGVKLGWQDFYRLAASPEHRSEERRVGKECW